MLVGLILALVRLVDGLKMAHKTTNTAAWTAVWLTTSERTLTATIAAAGRATMAHRHA